MDLTRERYEELFNDLPVGVFRSTIDGEIVQVNSFIVDFMGADSEDELKDHNLRDIYENPERRNELVSRVRKEGSVENETVKIRTLDDSPAWISLTLKTKDQNGNLYLDGIFEDVTEEQHEKRQLEQREQEVRKQSELLEVINSRMPGVAYQFKVSPEGEFSFPYISEGFEELSGATPVEVRDDFQNSLRNLHPDDYDEVMTSIDRAVEQVDPWEQEYRYELPDGTVNWVRGSSVPEKRSDGSIVYSGVLIDITERKEAEEALERQIDLFSKAQNIANVGAWEYDLQTDEARATDQVKLIHGLSANATLTPEESIQYYHPQDRSTVQEGFEGAVNEGKSYDVTLRLIDENDQTRWVRTRGEPQYENGEVVRVRGTIQDITQRRKSKNQLDDQRKRFQSLFDEAPIGLYEEDWSGVREYLEQIEVPSSVDLRSYLDEHPEIIKEIASNVEVLLSNRRVVEMVSAEGKEHLKQNFETLLTDDSYRAVKEEVVALWDGETNHSMDTTIKTFEDETKNIRRKLQLVPGHEDDWSRVFVSYEDVTDIKETQEQLAESEQRFRQLAENIEDVFWLTDCESNVIYVSPAFEQIWGIPTEKIYEDIDVFYEAIHPDDRERIKEALFNRVTAEYDEEYRIIRPNGEVRWIHDRAYRVDQSQEETRIAGIAEDITERKQREQELKTLTDRLDLALEGGQLGVWDWQVQTGEVTFDERWAQMLGYTLDELDPAIETWEDKVHPEDMPRAEAALEAHFEGETEYYECDHRMRSKNGEWVWIRDLGQIVEWNEEGEPVRAVGIHQDITERKKQKQELQRSRDLLERTEQLASVGGWEVNAETEETRWTDGTYRIHDLDPDSDFDPTVDSGIDFYHPKDRDTIKQAVQQCLEEGEPYDLELRLITQDDRQRWVRTRGQAIYEDGEIVSVRGAIRDITEEKELRHELELFQKTIDYSPDCVFIIDPETFEFIDVNQNALDKLGYDREELLELSVFDIEKRYEEDLSWEKEKDQFIEGSSIVREGEHEKKNGETFPVEVQARYVSLDDEDRLIAIARDVTDRREQQRKLEKSEQRFRQMAENIDQAYYMMEPDYSEVLYANPAVQEIYGITPDEFEEDPMCWTRHIPDEDLEELESDLRDQQTGEMSIVQDQKFTVHHPERGERVIRARIFPILEDGRLEHLVGISSDVTEETRLREEITKQREFLETIINSLPNLIFVINWEGDYQLLNESMAEFLGTSVEEATGSSMSEFWSNETEEKFRQQDQMVMKQGDVQKIPAMELTHFETGEEMIFQTVKVPLDREKPPEKRRVLGIATDITKLKQVENDLRSTVDELRETRISRDYLRNLLDTLPGGFFTYEPGEGFTRVNRSLCEMLGYEEGELLDLKFKQIFAEEHEFEDLREEIESKSFVREERQFVTNDGSTVPVIFSATSNLDEQGNLQDIIAVGVDITQRKQAEQKLRESEQRFRRLSETIDEIFWVVEPDWSDFIYVNPAYEEIVGRSRDVLLNEDPTDFLMGFHPEDREKTREYMHEISAGEEVDFEVRVNPDENYNRWLLIHGRAFRDDEGNVTRIFGTAQDITERKRAEKSLQQQSESLEDVYEIVSDTDLVLKEKLRRILKVGCDRLGVNAGYVSRVEEDHQIFRAVYDPDGRIEEEQRLPLEKSYCRETITRDATYTVFEASSEGWQNDPAYEQFGFESYIGKKVSIKEEFMGTVCWVDYEPGKFSDTDRAFVELMTELVGYELEQKLTLEELEQTLGEKETLLKEVHHRVKNNMAVISSMLSMQSAQIEEEAMRAKFEESLSRVKSMAIVHELLYQSEHLEEVQFEPYVDQLLDHLRQTFEPDQLNLTVETSIDDVAVDLDTAIPCGLILTELFSNTLQHAFPGRDRGTVQVRFERYDREYRLSVEDNGVGVPEDFDPQQTDSLGYDLIQALVGSNLQGNLTIDSTEGGGTTVTVQFE